MPKVKKSKVSNEKKNLSQLGGWPTLSPISTPEGAPLLCLRSLQTQGGDFDFLSPTTTPIC